MANKKATKAIKKRLEQIRQALRDQNISYGELAELQGLVEYIDFADVELLEPAGVKEGDTYADHCYRQIAIHIIEEVIEPIMGKLGDTEGLNDEPYSDAQDKIVELIGTYLQAKK